MPAQRHRPTQRPLDRELRFITQGLRVERRDAGESPRIVGHAAVYDQWTTLYEGEYWTWREIVRRGAFDNALREGQDVCALVNHDSDMLLGRSTSGTLKLSSDETGLLAEIDPPDTQCARDLLTLISRGDLSGMSFAFRVRPNGDRTTITVASGKETDERELLDLDLLDVSIVTHPAYPQTDVSIRSLADRRDVPHRKPHRRSLNERLQRLIEAD